MKERLIFVTFLFVCEMFYAQNTDNPFENKASMLECFDYMLTEKSYRYQTNRVIPMDFLDKFRQKIQVSSDSIISLNVALSALKNEHRKALLLIEKQQRVIKEESGTINFLGAKRDEDIFIFWGYAILFLLLLVIIFLLVKNRESYSLRKFAEESLLKSEEDYTILQKRSLEQKEYLSRKLQDEMLKNKK